MHKFYHSNKCLRKTFKQYSFLHSSTVLKYGETEVLITDYQPPVIVPSASLNICSMNYLHLCRQRASTVSLLPRHLAENGKKVVRETKHRTLERSQKRWLWSVASRYYDPMQVKRVIQWYGFVINCLQL